MFNNRIFSKICLVAITTLVLGLGFNIQPVHAQTAAVYKGSLKTQIQIQDNLAAQVEQTLDITNTSNQYLITKLDFLLPFETSNLLVNVNQRKVAAAVENGHLTIDLSKNPILIGSGGIVSIKYRINNFAVASQLFRSVYWPKFTLDNKLDVTTSIDYPNDWQAPKYISRGVIAEPAGGPITFSGSEDIYLSWGEAKSAELNIKSEPENKEATEITALMPLPNELFSNLSFNKFPSVNSGQADEVGNLAAVLKLAPKTKGLFEASFLLNFKALKLAKAQKHESDYYSDNDKFKINNGDDVFAKVMDLFNPEQKNNDFSRSKMHELLAISKQTPLMYAQALVAGYKKQNIEAEVVYGIAKLPLQEKAGWHYWVIKKVDENWIEEDPFINDLLSLKNRSEVVNQKISFGILPDNKSPQELGLANLSDISNSLKFNAEPIEVQQNGSVSVSLSLDGKAFAGENIPISLKISNFTNKVAYLESLEIDNVNISGIEFESFALLPNTLQVIPIPGIREGNIFSTSSTELKGEVIIFQDNQEKKLEVSTSFKSEVDLQLQLIYFIGVAAIIGGLLNMIRLFGKKPKWFSLPLKKK